MEVLALSEDGTLTRHVGQCEYLLGKEVDNVLLLNEDYLVIGKNGGKKLEVYSAVNLEKLY